MRACSKCGAEKPIDAFYRHPMGRGGHMSSCIECAKMAVRANRAERIEYYRAYDRTRAKEPHRAQARADYAKANPVSRPERDPVKRAARVAIGNALRDGRIVRPSTCEVCGVPCTPHGHYDDYTKP